MKNTEATTKAVSGVCRRGHVDMYTVTKGGFKSCRGCVKITVRKAMDARLAKGLTTNGTPPTRVAPEVRFWWYVEKTEGCWYFMPAVTAGRKYGNFGPVDGRKTVLAHRFAYTVLVGEIPDGLTVDHTCRVTQCVNPGHMELVTLAENLRRAHAHGEDCKNGHNYVGAGFFYTNQGWIVCKQCRKDSRAKADARKRLAKHL